MWRCRDVGMLWCFDVAILWYGDVVMWWKIIINHKDHKKSAFYFWGGDVAKKHFSVSLCTYVNLCIYVSKNHKKSAFYFVMWSLNEVETGDVAKKHFSVSLCTYVNLCIYVSKNHKKSAFYIAMSCDDIAYKKRQRTSRWRFFCVFMLIGWCLLAFSLFRALVFCHIVCLGAAIISLPKKMLLSILQLLGFGVH